MQHDMRRGVTIDVQQWCVVKLCDLCSLGSILLQHFTAILWCSAAVQIRKVLPGLGTEITCICRVMPMYGLMQSKNGILILDAST